MSVRLIMVARSASSRPRIREVYLGAAAAAGPKSVTKCTDVLPSYHDLPYSSFLKGQRVDPHLHRDVVGRTETHTRRRVGYFQSIRVASSVVGEKSSLSGRDRHFRCHQAYGWSYDHLCPQ